MLSEIKNKVKSTFKKKFDIKRSKSFDLDSHLEELEFYKDYETDYFCIYRKDFYIISINKTEETFSISAYGRNPISKLNFIPDSSMVLAMVIKLTLKKFETTAAEKRTN